MTTLTKRMAEELTDYLREMNVKVHYLHSEVDTLKRTEILRDLRLGVHDVVVGINLLREGLDLPEVSLVAVLDADKEGYLRSAPSLVQTMGRAARHLDGHVILYADRVTDSMRHAIDETERRRALQTAFNEARGVQPEGIRKAIRDIAESIREVAEPRASYGVRKDMSKDDLARVVKQLESEMKEASRQLEFEKAALLATKWSTSSGCSSRRKSPKSALPAPARRRRSPETNRPRRPTANPDGAGARGDNEKKAFHPSGARGRRHHSAGRRRAHLGRPRAARRRPPSPKFADWRMPDVETNVAALLRPDAPLPLRSLTDETGTPITEAEGLALGPGGRYAMRLRFANPEDAQAAARRVDFADGRAGTERRCP